MNEVKVIGCCAILAITIVQFFYLIWDIILVSPQAILITGIGLLIDIVILKFFYLEEAEDLLRKIRERYKI